MSENKSIYRGTEYYYQDNHGQQKIQQLKSKETYTYSGNEQNVQQSGTENYTTGSYNYATYQPKQIPTPQEKSKWAGV
jgi:hypothetical protein